MWIVLLRVSLSFGMFWNAGEGLKVHYASQQATGSQWVLNGGSGGKVPEKCDLFTTGGQINSLESKKPSKLVYLDCKLNANIIFVLEKNHVEL